MIKTFESAWDSITLKNMAESIIVHCELEGLDWSVIGLSEHDLTLVKARDTKHDTDQEKGKLAEQYGWDRIQANGAPHDHSFVRNGQEIRTAAVILDGK